MQLVRQTLKKLAGMLRPSRPGTRGHQPSEPTAQEIDEAVDYAIQLPKDYIKWFPGGLTAFHGRAILDVGPGRELTTPLIFAGLGARVVVVDKYPPPWDSSFHPTLYNRVRDALTDHFPGIDTAPFDELLSHQSHDCRLLEQLDCGLEEMDAVETGSIDLTLSNAVLEHLYDPEDAFRQLARVSKAGGLGLHRVDFRDHTDFSRPLEYLTMSDAEFETHARKTRCKSGSRLRYPEYMSLFEAAGFEVTLLRKLSFVDSAYLDDVLKRAQPRFKTMDTDALQVLGGLFRIRKPSPEAYSENVASLEIADSPIAGVSRNDP